MEKINIIDLIYKEMEERNIESQKLRAERNVEDRHFPSGLCAMVDGKFVGKCRRSSYYGLREKFEVTNEIDPVALLKMDMGNWIHNAIDEILTSSLKKRYEIEILENEGAEHAFKWQSKGLQLPVSGRIDKVVKFNGKMTGVFAGEWKSTYGAGVNYIKRDGAKIENVLQCLAYLEQDAFPIDAIWLLYVARDSGFLYGFQIEKDGDRLISTGLNGTTSTIFDLNWPMVEDALKDLEESLRVGYVPERDYSATVNPTTNTLTVKSDWQCRYCSYRSLCYGCQ